MESANRLPTREFEAPAKYGFVRVSGFALTRNRASLPQQFCAEEASRLFRARALCLRGRRLVFSLLPLRSTAQAAFRFTTANRFSLQTPAMNRVRPMLQHRHRGCCKHTSLRDPPKPHLAAPHELLVRPTSKSANASRSPRPGSSSTRAEGGTPRRPLRGTPEPRAPFVTP